MGAREARRGAKVLPSLALPLTLTPTLTLTTNSNPNPNPNPNPRYYHHSPYRAFAAPAALHGREQREQMGDRMGEGSAAVGAQRRRRGAARAD